MKHQILFALSLGSLCVACAAQPTAAPRAPGPAAHSPASDAPATTSAAPNAPTAPATQTDKELGRPSAGAGAGADTEPGEHSVATVEREPTRPALAPVDCDTQRERGQLALSPEQYELRTGKDAQALSAVHTSRQRPIEVCGVHDQHALLMALTCPDGSRPLTTTTDARRARLGSVGAGGRCGKPVDLYRVACPDRQYDVYMDAYYCRSDQSLDRLNTTPRSAAGTDDAPTADRQSANDS